MPHFKSTDVDSIQVSHAATYIDDDIKELQSIYKVIESGVMPNVAPYWQGQAKESFEQKFNLFAAELSILITKYQELNEQLHKAGTAYANAEVDVKQLIVKLPK